jgi:RNA polymerase sigma-70 factor (ECF subfamily)
MPDETALIEAVRNGDAAAFEKLVVAKRRLVVGTAYQITGNMEDAQDVAQRVLLTLWKSMHRYDPRRRFDTWLYRVTVNAAIDHHRQSGPRGVLQALPEDPSAAVYRSKESSADQLLDQVELQKIFHRLAEGLAPRQRAVFVLHELQGLSTAEVAEALEVTESTVRNHLLQARRILREGIERDYPGLVRSKRS